MKIKEIFKKKFNVRVKRSYGVHKSNGTFSYKYDTRFCIQYSYTRFGEQYQNIRKYDGLRQVYLLFNTLEGAEEYAKENFKTIEDVIKYNNEIEKNYLKEYDKYHKKIQVI